MAALLMGAVPVAVAHAADPPAHVEAVKIRVDLTDGGFNGEPGDFVLEVEQGHVVEMTFVWAHVGYVEEEHIMLLEGYKLETEKLNFQNREGTIKFIADKPGTFVFKCDLDCDVHDYLQRGYLKVKRAGSAPPPTQEGQGTGSPTGAAPSGATASGSGTAPSSGQAVPVAGPTLLPTKLSVSPSSWVTGGEPITLMAVLTDAKGKPVPKAEVRFSLDTDFAGTKGQVALGVAKTDGNGVAFLDYQPTLGARRHAIAASFEGQGLYDESQQVIQVEEVGVPPSAYTMPPIGLAGFRHWAPRALVLTIVVVWATFGFILYQALGVRWARARR
ncbi:MAG: hypothetical protein HY535_05380 [Chloroflexi bacterium]|nr:hypothetical protein [Chloroflexota bacterium]